LTTKFFGNRTTVTKQYKLYSDAIAAYEYNRQYYGKELAGARIDHPWGTIEERTDIFSEVL
jgi:hypothetical protein